MNTLAWTQNTRIVNLDTLDEKGQIRVAVAWDALSENTKMAYQKAYKRLSNRGVVVESLGDESLTLCISQLDAEGLSPATLSFTVAAKIFNIHAKNMNVIDPWSSGISSTLCALHRGGQPPTRV